MTKFINKGYSGENAEGLLEKWQADVIDNKPTVLSILVGVNDGGFGYFNGLTPDEAAKRHETNLRAIIEKTRNELGDIKIILCEPFYFPLDKSDYSYRYTPHPDDVEGVFKRPDSNDPEDSVIYREEVNKKSELSHLSLPKNLAVYLFLFMIKSEKMLKGQGWNILSGTALIPA